MSIECEYCGRINEDGTVFCIECGMATSVPDSSAFAEYWEITCPKCGKTYTVSDEEGRILICDGCEDEDDRFDIAGVRPKKIHRQNVKQKNNNLICKATELKLVLFELRKNKEIVISDEGILGRLGDYEPDFFEPLDRVSRHHCRFVKMGINRWAIEHIADNNLTCVNGEKVLKNALVILSDEDIIRIADQLVFRVRFERLEKEEVSRQEERWEIICPVCGKRYIGENKDFRISECVGSCRYDEFDRYEIGKVRPRKVPGNVN